MIATIYTSYKCLRFLLPTLVATILILGCVQKTNADIWTWNTGSGGDWATGSNWDKGSAPGYEGDVDFSTQDISADRTITGSGGNVGNMIFGDTDGSPNKTTLNSTANLYQKGNSSITVVNGIAQINNRFLTGSGNTTKLGEGTLILGYAPNKFGSAGLILKEGVVQLNGNTEGGLGYAQVVTMDGGTLKAASVAGLNWDNSTLNITASGGTIDNSGAGLFRLRKVNVFTGTGNLTFKTGVLLVQKNQNIFAGTITLSGGGTRMKNIDGANFSDMADVVLNAGTALAINSGFTLGGVSGTGSIIEDFAGGTTLTLGNSNGKDYTFDGVMNGDHSLVKAGTNTQTMTGANTYTGTTTVNGGTLIVNGTHTGNGTYDVNDGATLSGNGSIAQGTVHINDGGTIEAGNSIGQFTTPNLSLNMGSTAVFEIQGTTTPGVDFDQIIVNNTLTYADDWTLVLRFQGPISGENTIQLFDAGTYSGVNAPTIVYETGEAAFSSYNLATGELTFSSAIPEPGPMALITLGGLLLLWRQHRRNMSHHKMV